ncbi:MAG: hypothetical protein IJJ17_03920 [Parasporobacterium sp.]|nr:hypothetical protein [Parasporobacterium sp.]
MDRKTQQKQKNRFIRITTLVLFAAIIILADIFLLADHNRQFSERENRVLAKPPVLTASNIISGKYMTKAESFVSDQFFLRDGWITYKLNTDKLLGKKESNGVYLGKQGYLIEQAKKPAEEDFERNLDAIRDFALRHAGDQNIVMTVIPNAVCVLRHLLPPGAPSIDQEEILRKISDTLGSGLHFVDLTQDLMAHRTEYIFYKSDHHWTSLGARYAFEALCPSLGITDPVLSYTKYEATDRFSGTLASASGASNVRDVIDLYVPDSDIQYVVEYVGESRKTATMYSSSALDTNNQYEVFLGGNHPLIRIRTTAANKKNLLLIKDSYANAFVQFLLPHFGSIYIVDPRYYSDDLDQLVTTSEITDILFLYNVNTFVEDNSIAGALTAES